MSEKAHEGISPGVEDAWVPSFAVSTDADIYDQLKALYLQAV
ncbi:hypothetical protein [Streptomyces sp. NPDC060022]